MTLHTLSIDGGASGGSTLLDPTGTRGAGGWSWHLLERKSGDRYVVRSTTVSFVREESSLHEVGRLIRLEAHDLGARTYHLVVEDQYLPGPTPEDLESRDAQRRYLGKLKRICQLSAYTALVYGPLLAAAASVSTYMASEWRSVILGSGWLSSSRAEDQAIALCTRGRPPLAQGLGVMAQDPHVAESACLARYAWLQRHPAQQALMGGR